MSDEMTGDGLWVWVRGSCTAEAAVMILTGAMGGRLVDRLEAAIEHGRHVGTGAGMAWVDWDRAGELAGPMSSGERRLLGLAASLAAGRPVDLSDALSGLDPATGRVVLDALAWALRVEVAQ